MRGLAQLLLVESKDGMPMSGTAQPDWPDNSEDAMIAAMAARVGAEGAAAATPAQTTVDTAAEAAALATAGDGLFLPGPSQLDPGGRRAEEGRGSRCGRASHGSSGYDGHCGDCGGSAAHAWNGSVDLATDGTANVAPNHVASGAAHMAARMPSRTAGSAAFGEAAALNIEQNDWSLQRAEARLGMTSREPPMATFRRQPQNGTESVASFPLKSLPSPTLCFRNTRL